MLTRETFAKKFARRAVFGMVHIKSLPGAPIVATDVVQLAPHVILSREDGEGPGSGESCPAPRSFALCGAQDDVGSAGSMRGRVDAPVDQKRVEKVVRAFKAAGGR